MLPASSHPAVRTKRVLPSHSGVALAVSVTLWHRLRQHQIHFPHSHHPTGFSFSRDKYFICDFSIWVWILQMSRRWMKWVCCHLQGWNNGKHNFISVKCSFLYNRFPWCWPVRSQLSPKPEDSFTLIYMEKMVLGNQGPSPTQSQIPLEYHHNLWPTHSWGITFGCRQGHVTTSLY